VGKDALLTFCGDALAMKRYKGFGGHFAGSAGQGQRKNRN